MSSAQSSIIEGGSTMPDLEETSFYDNMARAMAWSQLWTHTRLEETPYDATTFIAAVSELDVDVVPITWHAGMGEIGRGKSAQIQQSMANLDIQFAFKRFTFPGSEEPDEGQIIRAAMIELSALSHPALQAHRNFLKMYGVCWDIVTAEKLFRPVLVVEKSSLGDLGHFMSKHGNTVNGEDRVELCADVICAVATLHANGIIHGDIKPQNFLVFQAEPGVYYLKLADFGFSTLTSIGDEDTKVDLPISWPWSAPELSEKQHGFPFPAAKATDVYSVGLICLWLMLGEKQLDLSQNPWSGGYEWLSHLKQSNELMEYARSRIEELEDVDQEMKSSLLKLFQWTTIFISDKRIPTLTKFIGDAPVTATHSPSEELPLISIRKAFGNLMLSKIALRKHIMCCLQLQLVNGFEKVQKSNAAFQLAVCYYIGFGGPEDDGNITEWLGIAEKNLGELQLEIELIRTRDLHREIEYKNEDLVLLAGGGFFSWSFDSNEKRSDVQEEELSLSRELEKMQQVLIPSDYIIIALQRELANTLQTQGRYSRALSILWNTLQFLETDPEYGPSHPRTLYVALDVLEVLHKEGDYEKGIELGERKLRICQEVYGDRDILTAYFQVQLASIFREKGHYKSSEILFRQGLETKSQCFGKRHLATLATMKDIGDLLRSCHRYEEALDILSEVVEGAVETLGREHSVSLAAIGSVASVLLNMNSYWQAESLFNMQAAGSQDLWGEDDVRLARIMNGLAMAIVAQSRYDEAKQLSKEAVAKAERFLGDSHYETLHLRSNLAFILLEQAEYAEAETILRELIPKQEAQLGEFHSGTLIAKIRLTLAIQNQGRLEETKSLLSEILDSSKGSTDTSMDHLYHLLKIRILLGHTLQMMGASKAAIQEIHRVLEGQATTLEDDHADAFGMLTMLPCLLQQYGFLLEAEKHFAAAVLDCEATLGESHIETLTALYWLATLEMLADRFGEADALLQRVSTGIIEARAEGHWSTQRVQLLLTHWSNYKESKQREADEEAASNEEP